MAHGFAPFLGRLVFLSACPLVAWLAGSELDIFVVALSALACVFEVALFGCGGGKKAKNSIRPARFFPLQLCLLYCIQLWLFLLHQSIGGQVSDHRAVPADAVAQAPLEHPASVKKVAEAAPLSPSEHHEARNPVMAEIVAEVPVVTDDSVVPAKRGHPDWMPAEVTSIKTAATAAVPAVPASRGGSSGSSNAVASDSSGHLEGFDLDAPIESLRWNPKTISVVLPCAEERDFALKTVKSFWDNTPAGVLHEIVVVDDGSNPPLSQTHLKPDVQDKYKVKICRHEQTVGLIGAKKTGGDAASGDIVAFFDCHVAPQPGWHEDFLRLIGENYRRMVVPQITNLDIHTWKQIGDGGGGMSKCYVTWDGDFKWGGPDDMYMGMLSGGLAGMSKRWWDESGGFDSEMMGWGGENIDQGVRMWVCGGEIVAAPNAQVAHMWRVGTRETSARYKHVGDTMKNRARAINAWFGDFSQKLDDFPTFKSRKDQGGENWFGDMSNFQKVKDRLGGCRPFAWYLRRFKSIYEDGGIIPPDIFMIREEKTGKCLQFQGHAGTSGAGKESVALRSCNPENPRNFWHLGNVNRRSGGCCSGLRAWNTEQCFQGTEGRGSKATTGICEVNGRNDLQHWSLTEDGQLRKRDRCLGPGDKEDSLKEAPCISFRSSGGARFTKQGTRMPIETELYQKAQREHPEVFKKLNEELAGVDSKNAKGPVTCQNNPGTCLTFTYADGSKRCLDDEGQLTGDKNVCAVLRLVGKSVQRAENGQCLDSASDDNAESWVFYGCHGFANQQFSQEGSKVCSVGTPKACFETQAFGR